MHLDLADVDPALLEPVRDLPRQGQGARGDHAPIIVEGIEAVRWLLRSPLDVGLVLLKPSVEPTLATELEARPTSLPVVLASRGEIAGVLGFPFERGVVAVARRPALPGVTELPATARAVLVADAVHDPANLGSLVRTARCLGLDGLVIGPGSADPWYRRCVRVSVGHVFHLPLFASDDLVADLRSLQATGRRIVAAHRGPLSEPVRGCRQPWALVLGNEDRGVTPAVAALADERWFVPMATATDSLNLGVAAGIMAFALGGSGA